MMPFFDVSPLFFVLIELSFIFLKAYHEYLELSFDLKQINFQTSRTLTVVSGEVQQSCDFEVDA